jgi:4-azaleucine resistance transporter AzlC
MEASLNQQSDHVSGFLCGLRESISVSLAGGLFGFVFGILAISYGLTNSQTVAMSALVYAGTAQVVSLSILMQPSFSMISLLIMTVAICSRYFLMGITIRALIDKISIKSRLVSLFTLMDENWALTMLKARHHFSPKFLYGYFFGSGLLAYAVWVLCTIIGVIFSSHVHNPQQIGLDFVFTALFLALLVGSWRGKQELLPWIASFILSIVFKRFLPGDWNIVCAALVASTIGILYESCF